MNWKPVRKIAATFAAFIVSGAGVTLIDELVHTIPVPWIAAIVGGIPVIVGYLVPAKTQ